MKRKCSDDQVATMEEDKGDEEEVTVLETHRFRKLAPAHCTFKIQSFSMLSKNGVEKYESKAFDVGGYKWKLLVYPGGNKKLNGHNHISLYLVIANADSLPSGWEAEVVLRLFLFDQIRDRYLVRGDAEGGTSRYHEMKKEQGFSQFLSLAKFNNQSYGYLVDDTCMFGAEIFVYKRSHFRDCLSMVKEPATVKYTWKIENYSKITNYLYSDRFKAANENWSLIIYPKGRSTENDNYMSLFLCWRDYTGRPDDKVYAEFKLRLRDQIQDKHVQLGGTKRWFSAAGPVSGWSRFILLDVLNGNSKTFLMNDTCIIDAEMKVLGTTC